MTAETTPEIVITPVKNEGELMQALALREIVFIEELPRNATGKVLKRELAEREVTEP